MGPELRRDNNQNVRSKWWYGRYIINGERKFVNLGVEIKGRVQETLRWRGDGTFELSRIRAQTKLDGLISDAHSCKTAARAPEGPHKMGSRALRALIFPHLLLRPATRWRGDSFFDFDNLVFSDKVPS